MMMMKIMMIDGDNSTKNNRILMLITLVMEYSLVPILVITIYHAIENYNKLFHKCNFKNIIFCKLKVYEKRGGISAVNHKPNIW